MLAKSEIQRKALNLPARESIELVVELWDSLSAREIPLPDCQRDLIRDRLAATQDIPPQQGSAPWGASRKPGLFRQDVTLPVRLMSAAVQDVALAEWWYLDEAPHVLAPFERYYRMLWIGA